MPSCDDELNHTLFRASSKAITIPKNIFFKKLTLTIVAFTVSLPFFRLFSRSCSHFMTETYQRRRIFNFRAPIGMIRAPQLAADQAPASNTGRYAIIFYMVSERTNMEMIR